MWARGAPIRGREIVSDPLVVSRFIDEAADGRQLVVRAGATEATFSTPDDAGNPRSASAPPVRTAPTSSLTARGFSMSDPSPARILSEEVLSAAWGRLTRYTIAYTRRDGRTETQIREVYDHGNGSAVLPLDAARGTVLLVRQFRLAAHLQGGSGYPRRGLRRPQRRSHARTGHPQGGRGGTWLSRSAISGRHRHLMSAGSLSERISLFMAALHPRRPLLRRRRRRRRGRGHRGPRDAAR